MDVGRRLRGGAADALGKAGGAIQGGLGRVGGWLSELVMLLKVEQ